MKVRFDDVLAIGITVLVFGVLSLATAGWISNLVKLVKLDFEEPYKAEVIRTVGLLPPIGAIVGWVDIEDEHPTTDGEK